MITQTIVITHTDVGGNTENAAVLNNSELYLLQYEVSKRRIVNRRSFFCLRIYFVYDTYKEMKYDPSFYIGKFI